MQRFLSLFVICEKIVFFLLNTDQTAVELCPNWYRLQGRNIAAINTVNKGPLFRPFANFDFTCYQARYEKMKKTARKRPIYVLNSQILQDVL